VPSAWLILPTYNEADNIEPFVRSALPRLAAAAGADHRVLVVDDSSPDGTGEIADRLAAEHDAVEVLHRTVKDGLGRAYLAGFARALGAGADLVMQMDSDFSHDPDDIGRLVVGTREHDLVLGSRYVPGGGITNWGLVRRALSRGGSAYARTILGVPVRDLTGGFKCFRREVLERLDLSGVHADGYGFQIELTYRTLQAGFRVLEVPIVFHERRAGASKMSARIAVEAVWKVPALRLRRAGTGPGRRGTATE
jgi:dolichol-phosphate mannosyltransferase